MSKRRKLLAALVGLTLLAALAGFVFYQMRRHPLHQFDLAVRSIGESPERWVGEQVGISTYVDDQAIVGRRVSSEDVNSKVVWAFNTLSSTLRLPAITYYCEVASMPTQETVWQYPDFFVRLYVTSSLDTDGATVGCFDGVYTDLRQVSASTGEKRADRFTHFAPIEFEAPGRFLENR